MEFFSSQLLPDYLWGPSNLLSGVASLGAKRPGREADHSPPSSVGVISVCVCVCLWI